MPLSVDVELGDKPTINVSGKEIAVMRQDQLNLLGGKGRLMELVKEHFQGHKPDDVHISDETTSGKLAGTFGKYNWDPVQVIVSAQGGKILEVKTELEGVVTQPVYNIDPDTPSRGLHELWRDRTNSVDKEHHWDVNSTLSQSFSAEISGGFDLGLKVGGKVSGTTGFEFSAGYGESKRHGEAVTIGSKAGIEVELKPMDATVLVLTLNVGKVVARAEYLTEITGGVFTHFGKRVNGHYLWYVPLHDLYNRDQLRARSHDILKIDNYINSPVGNRQPQPGEIPEWEKAVKAWLAENPDKDLPGWKRMPTGERFLEEKD